jgi:5-oxoprolinase (ATP-hydrolysing)
VWKFWIDVGGTFTDCIAENPAGHELTIKVLSSAITKNRWPGLSDRLAFADQSLSTAIADFWLGYRLVWQDDRGVQIGESRVNGSTADGKIAFEECDIAARDNVAYYELHSPEPSPIFAVRRLAQVRLDEPLPDLEMFLGTTRGTNALLTRRGAKTVFAVTAGFQDLLEIGEQDRPNLFELTIRKTRPLYQSVIEIPERVAADGVVLRPIDIAATARS